ncbi:MAG: SDR family oxidoreductase [Clostridia bacterium]|nr:SDR family oxidoreductase [Clostridia bacterium]
MEKFVMITGASGGTGFAIARRFAREGWNVVITSRNEAEAKAAAESVAEEFKVQAEGFQSQSGSEEAVRQMFQSLQDRGIVLSALVLNAADLGMGQKALEVPLEDWRQVLETNLVWNFSLMREAARQMKDAGGGSIVVIGSNTARRAIPDRSAYIASKGGLVSLSKALAVEWGQYGIRVNVVVSGSIKTARWAAQTEEWRQVRRDRSPIGDIADFEDIANSAYFLACDQSRVITGAELVVDGGVDAQFLPKNAP